MNKWKSFNPRITVIAPVEQTLEKSAGIERHGFVSLEKFVRHYSTNIM